MELWKDIEDYNGLYQVSKSGLVRSLDRLDSAGRKRNGKVLKPSISKKEKGYLGVGLCKNGIVRFVRVHRLVAETFLDVETKGLEVNHKNGIKTDNNASNLEWCTHKENVEHAVRTGLVKKTTKMKYIPKKKHLTKQEKGIILAYYAENKITQVEVCKKFGIGRTLLVRMLRNSK